MHSWSSLKCNNIFYSSYYIKNDSEDNHSQNFFCMVLGYLDYFTDFLQNYSYLLNAIYQYIAILYPARILWRSFKFQISLIGIQWIFAIAFFLSLLLIRELTYHSDVQICQIPLRLFAFMIYVTLVLYSIPNSAI